MENSEFILDQETPTIAPSLHLKRSVIILRFYGVVVLVFVSLLLEQSFLKQSLIEDILAVLTGLGVFMMLAASPFGIFYTLKAFSRKEGNATARLWHLVCHTLVLVVVGLIFFMYFISPQP